MSYDLSLYQYNVSYIYSNINTKYPIYTLKGILSCAIAQLIELISISHKFPLHIYSPVDIYELASQEFWWYTLVGLAGLVGWFGSPGESPLDPRAHYIPTWSPPWLDPICMQQRPTGSKHFFSKHVSLLCSVCLVSQVNRIEKTV